MMRQFSKRTFSGLVGVALLATACTGDGDNQATPDDGVGRTIGGASETASTTTTEAVAAETATTTTVLAPSTLAFSSSDDIGRLFSVSQDITASRTAGGLPDASAVAAGTIVQASSQRDSDDALWVRVESTELDGPTLGWVPATLLEPTLESVFYQDNERARELRQVSSSAPDDQLVVLPSPGAGAALRALPEDSIAMHGGVTGLSPNGDYWLDIIDPASGERTGWVEARYFSRVSGGEIQDSTLDSVSRSPENDVTYGQALNGAITLAGCNAVQVTFTNPSSSAGIGMTLGTSSPIGRERNNGSFDWSGTSAFSEAGEDVIVTIPLDSAKSWFFAPLDADEEASFTSRNEDGFAIATGVVEIPVPASSCVFVPPTVDQSVDEGNAAYIEDLLTEAEREEARASLATQAEAEEETPEESEEDPAAADDSAEETAPADEAPGETDPAAAEEPTE